MLEMVNDVPLNFSGYKHSNHKRSVISKYGFGPDASTAFLGQ